MNANDQGAPFPSDRSYGFLRFAIAMLLTASSLLKALSPAPAGSNVSDLLGIRISESALVAAEIVVAALLLSNAVRRTAWSIAVVCFISFCIVSGSKAIGGDRSCGCFGSIVVHPWIILGVDAFVVIMLFAHWRVVWSMETEPSLGRVAGCALGGIALSLVVLLRLSPGFADAAGVSGLVPDVAVHDFGTVSAAGGKNVCSFSLHNKSRRTVRILRVRSSCGCTVGEPTTNVVAAGGSTEIRVTANFAGRAGPQAADIMVTTDALAPDVNLRITGFVRVKAAASSRRLNFGLRRPGEVVSRELSVTSGVGEPEVTITDVVSSDSRFVVTRDNGEPVPVATTTGVASELPQRAYGITFHAPADAGRYEGVVTFRIGQRETDWVKVSVVGEVEPPLAVLPSRLMLRHGGESRGSVTLGHVVASMSSRDPGAVNARITVNEEDFFVQAVTPLAADASDADTASYSVEVGFRGQFRGGTTSKGELRISCGSNDITVPLMCIEGGR